jgi:hypothetical protein
MRLSPLAALACWLLLFAGGAAAQPSVSLVAFAAALRGANASVLSTWTGSTPCSGSWQGVWCASSIVTRVRLSGLLLNGTLSCDIASVSTLTFLDLGDNQLTGAIPSCLFNLPSLAVLDVSRNWLTGALPTLPSNYTAGQLFFSVFDNQLQGTVPSGYTRLRSLALAMNPGVYGPWPATLEPASFSVPGGTNGLCQSDQSPAPWSSAPYNYGGSGWTKGTYTAGSGNAPNWQYPYYCDGLYSPLGRWQLSLRGFGQSGLDAPYPPTAADINNKGGQNTLGYYFGWYPSYGSGFFYGTSLGLDEPLYVLLRRIAAALDPSGTLLPSWANGIQPCLPTWGSGQRSTSPGFGQAWVGVAPYCVDGAYAGSPFATTGYIQGPTDIYGWQAGSNLPQFATGGITQITLTGLGLNGTLPADIRLLRTLTILDLSQHPCGVGPARDVHQLPCREQLHHGARKGI